MRTFWRRRTYRSAIDAEIDAHLAEKTAALIAAGIAPEDARPQARRAFGNVSLIKELSREEWSFGEWDQIAADVRFAWRSLKRNPVFAATAILTLALGIGANAAIFNLLHAVILRSLPVPAAEQLRLFSVIGDNEAQEPIFSYPVLRQMQDAVPAQALLAGFSSITTMRTLDANGGLAPIGAQLVTGNFFDVLAVKAQKGRLLTSADDQRSSAFPAIMSATFWAKRFASDPSAIGRFITVNDTPIRLIGVAPSSFFGVSPGRRPDLWLPVSAQHDLRFNGNIWNSNGDSTRSFLTQPEMRWLSIVARVPGSAALGRITAIVNQLFARDMQREIKGWSDPVGIRRLLSLRIRLDAGDKGLASLRRQFSAPLTVLMCAAGFVLLIAGVNLASLALARAVARRREIAIRRSLGASGRRIVSQVMTEILLLSLVGGALAIPVALGVSSLLLQSASRGDPMPLDVALSPSLLLFVAAAALAAGVSIGLLPALEALHFPVAGVMKSQAASLKGMRLPWGRTLLAVQITFAFVLLTAAILFVRTLFNYVNLNLGFTPESLLSVRIDPLGAHYQPAQLTPLYRQILEKLQSVPGLQSASFTSAELAAGPWGTSGFHIPGRPPADERIQETYVSPSYFATVGMRLVSGRFFDSHAAGRDPVWTVINQAAARKFFSEGSPLGRRFAYGHHRFEVIGVVADAHIVNIHQNIEPMAFYSLEQSPEYANSLAIRAQGSPLQLERAVRAALHQAAPGLPVMSVRTVAEILSGNLFREKLVARLASAFALLALALASLGVYGVLAYAVTRRTPEIGIRLALGAERGHVRWLVLREALAIVLIGLASGIPAAVFLTRLIKGLLYGLSPTDLPSLITGGCTLFASALCAAFIPAWRASRVDPNVALRYE